MELLSAPKTNSYKEITLKVLSVVGAVAVIAGVAWVGFRGLSLFPNAKTFLANAISGLQSVFVPADRIVISTVDSQIVVNKPFTLTWEHRGKDNDGSYVFSYECSDDVFLARRDNGTQTTIFCNTQVPVPADEKEIALIAVGDIDGVIEIPVRITFTENNLTAPSLRGDATLFVQDAYLDTATSTDTVSPNNSTGGQTTNTTVVPQHTTVPVVTQPFSDPNGEPDLAVRVLGYGLVNTRTGAFTEEDEIPYDLPSGRRAAIQFEIINLGTKESGTWKFEVELPTSPSYTYDSDRQQSLFPGDKIVYTIGFDRVRNADEDDYTITADPDRDIAESNERNNSVDGEIDIDR